MASYIAVVALTVVLYWMVFKEHLKSEIEQRIESLRTPIALVGFTFAIAFREVLEIVLFLIPFFVRDLIGTIRGMLVGIFVAIGVAYTIYRLSMRLNLRSFFYFTSILLVFVASGLAGYGTHELIEWAEDSGIYLGFFEEAAYEFDIPPNSILSHKGLLGSIFAVLFGYSTKMEWGRVIIQFGYLIVAMCLILSVYGRRPAS